MRALILSLAAAGFVLSSLPGYAGGEPSASQAKLDQQGRAADDEPNLKSAGTSGKVGRSLDEDVPLKPSGASSKPERKVEEITPLRATGGVNRPTRIEDDSTRK